MKKLLRIPAILYAAYLALVLLVLTPALNFLPPWLVDKYLGRELHTEIILFNPFTLSLEVRKAELPEHDGTRFAGFDSAKVNLSLASLWRKGLVFDEVGVDQLYLHVRQLADGSFNFSDMIPPASPEEPAPEPSPLPGITIDRFQFQAQQLVFTDEAREKPSSTRLDSLAINIEGLSTVAEDGKPYSLEASGDGGGKLHWEGHVSLPNAYSEGTLTLSDIQLRPLWRFAEPWVRFELTDGAMSVDGHYRVDWRDELDYRISGGEIRLDNLAVRPGTGVELPDTNIALSRVALAGIELDGGERHADAQSLTIDGLAVSGWSEGSRVSLAELFAVTLPEETTTPAAEDTTGENSGSWTAALTRLQLTDGSLRWRSEFTEPALLEVTPLEFTASDIKWPLAGDTGLKLQLSVNGQATASVEGKLDLAQGAGDLNYQLTALPLPWFNPNFPAALKAEITDGQLQVAGELSLAEFLPTQIGMDGAITGASGKLKDTEASLTSWDTVRWEKLLVDLENHTVDLAKLTIDNYSGRIHINKDGSINTQNLWKEEVSDEAQQVADTMAEGKPWVVNVPAIAITDSEIDFMDESLPISFRTVIGDLNGDIKGISTKPGARTKVDIKGSVDGYAPVTLAGTAEPLRSPPALDLELSFEGVDMALLTPYSGTYAGYAIERGVLNLDLKYALQDDRLKGNNRILINQMKLGEKVASDKAADVPLELALALLTDSQGVIDMEIPVSGDVNNPEFSVGSVVWGAVVNLVTKAVTAPFTLLANLVGSEEDLQRLNFKSGSAVLEDSAREKLVSLAGAMTQRPELNLAITGRLQLKADRERLQKNSLQAEMIAAGLTPEEWSTKGPGWETAIEARYQALSPGATELTVREQYLALARNIPLPDEQLLALATERAVAVKTYLVNEAGLGADRAAIAKTQLADKANLYSGVELAIDI